MSLWPVIRDLFIRRAAEVVIEEVTEAAQDAPSNRNKEDKKESTIKQYTQEIPNENLK
jgi:hypothetical protein